MTQQDSAAAPVVDETSSVVVTDNVEEGVIDTDTEGAKAVTGSDSEMAETQKLEDEEPKEAASNIDVESESSTSTTDDVEVKDAGKKRAPEDSAEELKSAVDIEQNKSESPKKMRETEEPQAEAQTVA
eukprot:GILK01010155.1.p1 GENE.GILK01010155.1~~GILK01010155.1.p1  ORF type:complete len:128 (-),score=36.24 GILK01010155.1:583-966(-)